MSRFIKLAFVSTLMFVALLGASQTGTLAQGDDATAQNPIVGSWIISFPGDHSPSPAVGSFLSDGVFLQLSADKTGGAGAWEAAEDGSITMTMVTQDANEDGTLADTVTIRASLTVADDGQSWSGDYSVAVAAPDGSVIFVQPDGKVQATRIVAETMDQTPAMPAGTPTS